MRKNILINIGKRLHTMFKPEEMIVDVKGHSLTKKKWTPFEKRFLRWTK